MKIALYFDIIERNVYGLVTLVGSICMVDSTFSGQMTKCNNSKICA